MPVVNKHPAIQATATGKECRCVRIKPTRVGPKNPPRLPTELIKPTAAAAADAPSDAVGRTQNDVVEANSPLAVRLKQTISNGKFCWNSALAAKDEPHTIMARAAWSFRSPVRSEEALTRIRANTPTKNGTAVNQDASRGRRPETRCTVSGNHIKNAELPTFDTKRAAAILLHLQLGSSLEAFKR